MAKLNKNKNKNNNQLISQRDGGRQSVLSRPQLAPVAKSQKSKNREPTFKNEPRGVRIAHTEYVADVLRSATSYWNITQDFVINPGNVLTFPWLAQIALNFETYKIHKLKFMARTQQPSTITGAYYMCFSYDADDSAPTTKQSFMAERSAVSGAIWQNLEIEFLPRAADMYKEHFVAVGNPSAAQYGNAKLYNAGNFYIAVDGNSGSSQLADLYIEYDISFYTPSIVGYVPSLFGDSMINDITGTQLSNGTISNTQANPTLIQMHDSATARKGTVHIVNPGTYLLEWYVAGTAPGPNTPTWSSPASDTVFGEQFYTPFDVSIGSAMYTSIVNVVSSHVDVSLLLSAITTLTSSKLRVAPIPFSTV